MTAAVFPTCVGMNRDRIVITDVRFRVPHVRGDEPPERQRRAPLGGCSPRAWG